MTARDDAVTLWRWDHDKREFYAPLSDVERPHLSEAPLPPGCEEFKALPAPAFDALLRSLDEARRERDEARGARKAVEDELDSILRAFDEPDDPPHTDALVAMATDYKHALSQLADIERIEARATRAEAERDEAIKNLADATAGNLTIHELIVRNGKARAEFSGEMVQEIGLLFVDAYRKAKAINYVEMLFHGKTEAGDLERFMMTIQRVAGKSPHECRVEAEAARDAALARVARLESALRSIMSHPNAAFNVAAVARGTPTIADTASSALAGDAT